MKFLIFILGLLTTGMAYAHMIKNDHGQALGSRPYFNCEYIKAHKIKSIKGYYISKRPSDILREMQDVHVFEFNELGQVVREYKTMYNDTLLNAFEYYENGKIKIARKSQGNEFYSYHYKYDDLGRLTRKEFRRDQNAGQHKLDFQQGSSEVMSIEKYEYENLDYNDYKRRCYNNEGELYREEFYYFDLRKNLILYESRNKTGAGYSKSEYTFNASNQLIEMISSTTLINTNITHYKFDYDEKGKLMGKYYYRNQVYVNESQLVYSNDSGHMVAVIIREEATGYMTIIKYKEFEFFN